MKKTLLTALLLSAALMILLSLAFSLFSRSLDAAEKVKRPEVAPVELPWRAPDTASIPDTDAGRLIKYGRELVVNTPYYLGPKGSVTQVSNSLSCQNCHLDAGTRLWGSNFGGVTVTFPKYRHRSGTVENIEKKINDCFERSMNGKPLDTASRELKAMVAYIRWLGKDAAEGPGKRPLGTGLIKVPYLDRPADPVRGKRVYMEKCQLCHGTDGQGLLRHDGIGYLYPPLWGKNSYNNAAGIYRLAKFVSFVKYNMPYGVTFRTPELTDEEVWDVAAFVNSRPRPVKKSAGDWPDITKKPVDHPFSPYADNFTQKQHKYGPFGPIEAARKEHQLTSDDPVKQRIE